ncbi:type II toxin-antitoxin system RelE/ParE family toxin [Pseudoduganella sp. FT93W]|uniref:Type II toxin-antitoxin system RelE/ParE family toxin n=1 Tax=Duganella fentianensis TaxID=2692177 RepID=A0A845HS73_9BURK|nr:type II toxin-antitoxin system RelE/ParE family toxin [Duganella fentianensis]MYN44304.1 type II toxin-antitoxin system RelE/ParE family toxin [Duganella fentianensis]
MTHRVVLLASAEQDLKDLRTYLLKNFSSDTWASSYALIKHTIRQLQHFPQAGTIPDELEKLHLAQYRQALAGMNRIIYEVRQEVVYVHMIVDVRRDMKSLLTRRLLRLT